MGRTELLQGLRTMKFETLLDRWQRSELSQAEAAEALGMSERSFRRWHTRWLEEGEAGLHDRRLGQPSPRRMGRVPARGVGAERGEREAHGERSAPRAGLVIVDLR